MTVKSSILSLFFSFYNNKTQTQQNKKGKTTFAKSLPGLYNYFSGLWGSDSFNPYAQYTIYENVPWDKFEIRGYPDKRFLLTQGGLIDVSLMKCINKTVFVLTLHRQ